MIYMKYLTIVIIISILMMLVIKFIIRKSENVLTFPDGFLIGAATSSYQIEGQDDKGESIWDHFIHKFPEKIKDRSNAVVACDSYHKYKEDVKLLRDIGLDHYRFSLSWSRLLPTGYANNISKTGVQYYHNILDELEKYNIIPVVTIYHIDYPQYLEKNGGWLNETTAFVFAEYARFVFQEFGHRVKYFVTVNEISITCDSYYETDNFILGTNLRGVGKYTCAHNMLKAHALAYHIYDREFRKKQNGLIGFTDQCSDYYNKDRTDIEAENIAFAFFCGWTYNPIFSKEGNYPQIMIRKIGEISKRQGFNESRLPSFSKKWIRLLKGSADFLGLNHYSSKIVKQKDKVGSKSSENESFLLYSEDSGLNVFQDLEWNSSEYPLFRVKPKGFGNVLRRLKKEYDNPAVYVFENGVAVSDGLNDSLREEYLYSYMKEMLLAIKRDKCNVKMYSIWSLLDDFEWLFGYTLHFGLVHVDFNDKNRKRTMKNSVKWLRGVLESRELKMPNSLKK